MKVIRRTLIAVCLAAGFASGWAVAARAQAAPPARRLELKFSNGKVSLIAQGVTVREVMAEWARQCGCVVQGTDRLTGGVLPSMQFDDQPEASVLESLLRSAGGYLLGPRPEGSRGASIYGSVAVFPLVRGTAASTYSSPSPVAAPIVSGTPDDEIPPVAPVAIQPTAPATTPAAPPQPGRPGGPAPTAPPPSAGAGS